MLAFVVFFVILLATIMKRIKCFSSSLFFLALSFAFSLSLYVVVGGGAEGAALIL